MIQPIVVERSSREMPLRTGAASVCFGGSRTLLGFAEREQDFFSEYRDEQIGRTLDSICQK
jgi:hypothetical protein